MHIHILGVCGTFMGGIARLAVSAGYQISGSDEGIYPPMSDQLNELGVSVMAYDDLNKGIRPDLVLIGNVLARGHPAVEWVLNQRIPYCSGPDWLARELLSSRWVLAVAGTHGKTTVSSMLAWILEEAEQNPGFLIGGVPKNFGCSARLSQSPFFVIEADEYDTAFFDKRSKFVHYHPLTLIMHNLEFDHADIFTDLAQIQTQFHHLVRTVPSTGTIVVNNHSTALEEVLEMGCWSRVETYGPGNSSGWSMLALNPDYSEFLIRRTGVDPIKVDWELCGEHNALNALAAIAAAAEAGVSPELAATALKSFAGVKRRLELLGKVAGISVYDDFAHHPTAISSTLKALRAHVGKARIFAVLEPGSNSMKRGIHQEVLKSATEDADRILWLQSQELSWDLAAAVERPEASVYTRTGDLLSALQEELRAGDIVLIMSNGSFDGIHQKLLDLLEEREKNV